MFTKNDEDRDSLSKYRFPLLVASVKKLLKAFNGTNVDVRSRISLQRKEFIGGSETIADPFSLLHKLDGLRKKTNRLAYIT